MTSDPTLTFSPACPFKPWHQSQQTQSHAKRCEGEGDTERERGTSVRDMERVQGMQHPQD